MSYAEDCEDIGGFLADMDYRDEVCEKHEGDCGLLADHITAAVNDIPR